MLLAGKIMTPGKAGLYHRRSNSVESAVMVDDLIADVLTSVRTLCVMTINAVQVRDVIADEHLRPGSAHYSRHQPFTEAHWHTFIGHAYTSLVLRWMGLVDHALNLVIRVKFASEMKERRLKNLHQRIEFLTKHDPGTDLRPLLPFKDFRNEAAHHPRLLVTHSQLLGVMDAALVILRGYSLLPPEAEALFDAEQARRRERREDDVDDSF